MLHHPADRLRGAAGHLRARPHRPAQDLGGAVDGPIRAKVDVRVEALTDTRSRLTISVDFDGHGIGKVRVPLAVRRQARKEMPANVAMLKRRLETPQSTVRGAGIGE